MAGIDTQVKKEAEMPSEEKVRLYLGHFAFFKTRFEKQHMLSKLSRSYTNAHYILCSIRSDVMISRTRIMSRAT